MLLRRVEQLAEVYWKNVFSQDRIARRAIAYGLGLLLAVGRRTVTSSILARGLGDRDWSADYKLFSRSGWHAEALFQPAIMTFVEHYPTGPIPIAIDETKVNKTGAKIPDVSWQRDPLSPPFATNFIRAQRFLQASELVPHHQTEQMSARAIPVAFRPAPVLKRPGKRASNEEKAEYRRQNKTNNLSTHSVALMQQVRADFDRAGASERTMIFALDGSFCNKTVFRAPLERTDLIARARKDASLCRPAPEGSRRKYAPETFTPDQVRTDDQIPYRSIELRLGHMLHEVRFKEVSGILWRSGAGTRLLRLIVVAPQPYRVRGVNRFYRKPAFLLTTDLTTPVAALIQIYIDRWQIEVNHRDEKDLLGLGQAQTWSVQSANRHPTFVVALYSLLLTAALLEFGPRRTEHFAALPKWRAHSPRPSLLDLLRQLRQEVSERQLSVISDDNAAKTLLLAANA